MFDEMDESFFDSGDLAHLGDRSDPPVEVILVGDLFYARDMARRVEAWIVSAAARGAEILVGDPGRAYLPAKGLDLLEKYQVRVSPDVESVEVREARVYRFLPRDSSASRKNVPD